MPDKFPDDTVTLDLCTKLLRTLSYHEAHGPAFAKVNQDNSFFHISPPWRCYLSSNRKQPNNDYSFQLFVLANISVIFVKHKDNLLETYKYMYMFLIKI